MRIESTQYINFADRQFKYTTNVRDKVPCVARNFAFGNGAGGAGGAGAGAGGGAPAAPAPGAADPPSVPQQIGDAINSGIQSIFGGGGGAGGGGAGAGGAGAGAAGAGKDADVPPPPAN